MDPYFFWYFKETKRRLTKEEVEMIFENCNNSLNHLASNLMQKYFSEEELRAKNVTLLGGRRRSGPRLDPVRINFIDCHLEDVNRGPLSNNEMSDCRKVMANVIYHTRHKKILKCIIYLFFIEF